MRRGETYFWVLKKDYVLRIWAPTGKYRIVRLTDGETWLGFINNTWEKKQQFILQDVELIIKGNAG